MTIAFPVIEPWFSYTKDSLPLRDELLGVRRRISSRDSPVDEAATWDGKNWTRKYDGEKFPLHYYYAWRRFEV